MPRIASFVLLALVLLGRVAFAQLTISDIKDEAKRVDQRTLPAYESALKNRDIFASIHDSIHHSAYKEMQSLHAKYAELRAAVDKATAAHDRDAADKALDDLKVVAEQLSDQVPTYIHSSGEAVQKIQIGLGVFAFGIGGLVVWLFRRKKR
jgi:predicted negative regulator of RcsB-dependent stress response